MSDLSGFHVSAGDWRKQIRRNQRHTRWVIAIFIGLYTLIGILVDFYIASPTYHYDLVKTFHGFITLQSFPYATVLMIIIALVSLWITYAFYDRIMLLGTDYHEVNPETTKSLKEKQLYNVVEEMKVAAGLAYMPKVYIIEANYMNAFASGYSEKSAMVAITRGLMEKLDRSELEAVMAHEISHIRHQDIKLTLTASLLSNLMLIVIDLLFYNVVFGRRRREDSGLVMAIIILRYILPVISVLLLLYLSRTREYMADSGCVELMRDNQPLAKALLKIDDDYRQNLAEYRQELGNTAHEEVRRAAYLYDPIAIGADPAHSFSTMFSTHPDIKARLEAIGIKSK